jgi:hypothetical protein
MLNVEAAAEVVPRNRNIGLIPSDDFAWMIRKCWGKYEITIPQHSPKVRIALNQS